MLQFSSEAVPQLEQSLSWKSTGASGLITGTVSNLQQGKYQVSFFEKNGLRHGAFDLVAGQRVVESYWNSDSSILALSVNSDSENHISLWTMSNYHWYMKQVITFAEGHRPLWISWDDIESHR